MRVSQHVLSSVCSLAKKVLPEAIVQRVHSSLPQSWIDESRNSGHDLMGPRSAASLRAISSGDHKTSRAIDTQSASPFAPPALTREVSEIVNLAQSRGRLDPKTAGQKVIQAMEAASKDAEASFDLLKAIAMAEARMNGENPNLRNVAGPIDTLDITKVNTTFVDGMFALMYVLAGGLTTDLTANDVRFMIMPIFSAESGVFGEKVRAKVFEDFPPEDSLLVSRWLHIMTDSSSTKANVRRAYLLMCKIVDTNWHMDGEDYGFSIDELRQDVLSLIEARAMY